MVRPQTVKQDVKLKFILGFTILDKITEPDVSKPEPLLRWINEKHVKLT